jgi:hypothetical protein
MIEDPVFSSSSKRDIEENRIFLANGRSMTREKGQQKSQTRIFSGSMETIVEL